MSALVERDDLDELEDEHAAMLARLRAFLRVVWGVILYAVVPVLIVLALDAPKVDLFSAIVDPTMHARLGRLGVFVGAVAAVIATESLTHLGRPFGLGWFFLTVVVIGGAMFPFIAAKHDVALGLTDNQLAVALSYAYLILKVGVGVLVGAVMSWIFLAHVDTQPAPRRYTPRK